jgi:hypothetical protein
VKNNQYASAYWEEHKANFRNMLDELMHETTLRRVAQNASALCLKYNHAKREIPPEYNQKTILAAYEVLDQKLTKEVLYEGIDSFMEVCSKWWMASKQRAGGSRLPHRTWLIFHSSNWQE